MSTDYRPAGFKNRWLIRGHLTTRSPFHLGSGFAVPRLGLAAGATEEIQVKTVFRDGRGCPCIPGSSLKGILRARLTGPSDQVPPTVLEVFGKPEGQATNGVRDSGWAGRVHFLDAPAVDQDLPAGHTPPPFWRKFDEETESGRLTGITANVALNRRTRTAAHQKLFHTEFVPPGIRFEVSLLAHNLDDAFVASLLGALDQFNAETDPLVLGAKTGNGWGRFDWKIEAVRKLSAEHVKQWVQAQPLTPIRDALARLPPHPLAATTPAPHRDDRIRLKVTLHFDGPFLVKRPAPPKRKGTEEPNATPYLDERGRAVLPGSSFRGVLRSQAERVLRTLAPDPATADRWAPDPSGKGIEEVHDGDLQRLSLIGRVFGATGWRSPVEVTDFRDEQRMPARLLDQEMVAVDRFTGGAADGAKFRFRVVWSPVLTGWVTLRRDRWRWAEVDTWALGLWALILRDLQQGDLTFGLGAGKGYGHCRWAEFDSSVETTPAVASFHAALACGFNAANP